MTDLARGQAASAGAATPSPLSFRPRPQVTAPDSGRAAARAVLDDALRGIELTRVDRRFVARLSQWDKRTATTLAGLIARARRAGRAEAAAPAAVLPRSAGGPDQIETVLAALMDACAYRTSGAAAAGCWDCANLASGLCAEHARDADRAHAFAELAVALAGRVGADQVGHGTVGHGPPISPGSRPVAATSATQVTSVTSAAPVTPTTLARYRRRAAVAS